jgi:hypothetical protein
MVFELSRSAFYLRAFGRELYAHSRHDWSAGRDAHNRVWHIGRFEVIYSRQ